MVTARAYDPSAGKKWKALEASLASQSSSRSQNEVKGWQPSSVGKTLANKSDDKSFGCSTCNVEGNNVIPASCPDFQTCHGTHSRLCVYTHREKSREQNKRHLTPMSGHHMPTGMHARTHLHTHTKN